MTEKPPYRIAIIGVGGISEMHARAIGDLPNAALVAGCCRGEEKGRKFAADFNCTWYSDYEKLLDEAKPDVVTIATPSGAHLEPALASAERGVHVLSEKPLEITTQRVDKMIAAADKAGITLGGIFPERFSAINQPILKAAAHGRFGSLATVNTCTPWWREDDYYSPDRWQGTLKLDGGGALINQSIHGVDLAQHIAGRTFGTASHENPVAEVFAYTAKRGHDENIIEVEDTAVATLRFKNGALGQILATTSMYPGDEKRVQVGGRDGTAAVYAGRLITFQFRHEQEDDELTRRQFANPDQKGGSGSSDPLDIDYGGHTQNIGAFLAALEAGRTPAIDGAEARKAVAIIEAIYASAKSGKPVAVE